MVNTLNDLIFSKYSVIGDQKSKDINEAILNNDCNFIIQYYHSGKRLNLIDNRGENLLHLASKNHHYEVFDLLLHLGLDYNLKNIYGESVLHLAVLYTNYDIVQRIIFEGFDVNVEDRNCVSPLHIAASRGSLEIIRSLINAGAKINVSDENGLKPIHYAVSSGRIDVIRILLDYGASLLECDDRGNNVLHLSALKGKIPLVIYILKHMVVTNSLNIYHQTPLHYAAIHCDVTTLDHLLNRGYDPKIKDWQGKTALDLAKESNCYENYNFLENFINSLEYKEKFLKSLNHQAILHRNTAYLEQILNSSNINERDCFNRSLLLYAINTNQVHLVAKFLALGSDISSVDEFNHPALFIAIYNNNVKIVKLLLENNANPNEILYDRSYLYQAILKNNSEIFKVLISYGADINYIDSNNRSIFHYAFEYACEEIIDILNGVKHE